MKKISVVISAYNEEQKIEESLKSVGWADEIILVDNSSTDRTVEIAKKHTSTVYSQKNDPRKIDTQKNLGFEKAKNDWILCLDADERVSEGLKKEIQALLSQKKLNNGYYIPRQNIIFGKKFEYTGWYPDFQLRLFKKGFGKYRNEHVHEGIFVEGEKGYLKENLIHLNYETVRQFIQKNMVVYAQNEAEDLIRKDFQLKPKDLIYLPSQEFFSRYFLRKGYKDGLHGLFLSLLMAVSRLVALSYVWEKRSFEPIPENEVLEEIYPEFKKLSKETKFWIGKTKIDATNSFIKKLQYKIRQRV